MFVSLSIYIARARVGPYTLLWLMLKQCARRGHCFQYLGDEVSRAIGMSTSDTLSTVGVFDPLSQKPSGKIDFAFVGNLRTPDSTAWTQ
jgi:hypothetical protein